MNFLLDVPRRKDAEQDTHCALLICKNPIGKHRFKKGKHYYCSRRCMDVHEEMKRSVKDG